jgi:hypothetical protein
MGLPLQERPHHAFHTSGPITPSRIAFRRINDLERYHLTLGKLVDIGVQSRQCRIDKQHALGQEIARNPGRANVTSSGPWAPAPDRIGIIGRKNVRPLLIKRWKWGINT